MNNIVLQSDLAQWAQTHKKHFTYGDVVAVNGEMGFGKTTLIRHLIRAYGSLTDATSPTFALMDVHTLPNRKIILHIDAYRIKNEHEVLGLGLDQFKPEDTLIFIEWPQNIPKYVLQPNKAINIQLTEQDDARQIAYCSV